MRHLIRKIYDRICQNDSYFPLIAWLLSRGIILMAMLAIAPLLPAPPPPGTKAEFGWGVFFAWDSHFYDAIATSGYEYTNNQPGANVAFFPLFPLLIHLAVRLGFSVEIAGTLINNIAFLAALILLYDWLKPFQGISQARWATLVMAFCPLSLFGTVIYSEGLFLLFSIGALRAFERKEYFSLSVFGILATATRITGLALIPAFLLVSWRQKRSLIAYVASISTSGGVLLYSWYCWLNFNDPLAFISVQHDVWERQTGFDWQGWSKMLMQIIIGSRNWHRGKIVDIWHPFIFVLICILAYLLWRFRDRIGLAKSDYGLCFLCFVLWLLAGDPLLNTVSVLGGAFLLWHFRHQLSAVIVIYGLCGIGLLLSSGGTISLNRLAYGIIPLSIALGVLLSRHRRWGYCTMGFFCLNLILFSIRFTQDLWVA